MLGEDILDRAGTFHYFDANERADFLESRRKFVSQLGLGLAVPVFFDLWNYRRKIQL
jgi:hypothetical protein